MAILSRRQGARDVKILQSIKFKYGSHKFHMRNN
jgi:hypothetical protein